MKRFEGVFPVICIPFNEEEQVDEENLRRLVRFLIKKEISGVCVPAIGSEFYKLSDSERKKIVEVVIAEVGHRVPVIIGTGHPSVKVALEYTRHAEATGADGILVFPPYFVPPSEKNLLSYFKRIGESTSLPMMIQDAPAASGVAMSIARLAKMKDEISSFQYIKIEELPLGPKISAVCKAFKDGLGIFCGYGGMFLLDALSRGACGVMPGCAFADIFMDIYKEFAKGEKEKAEEIFHNLLPFLVTEIPSVEMFIACEKEVLRGRRIFSSSFARQPGEKLDDIYLNELECFVERLVT